MPVSLPIIEKKRCEPLTLSCLTIEVSTLAVVEITLPTFDLKAYARRGAEARVAELTAELNGIYNAFLT